MKIKTTHLITFLTISYLIFGAQNVCAQQASLQNHEKRLQSIEEYLEKLPPSMVSYVGSLEDSINKYTKDLEVGLNEYSKKLGKDIETQILGLNQSRIELNTKSNTYQKIDTATGEFLIAVQDTRPIEGGYRMFLQIGNPNYANYRNFTIRLVWGERWNPKSKLTYEKWRAGLRGAEFSYKGKLERGTWTPVEVDLTPAKKSDLAYIECELGLGSIELELR